MPIENTVLRTSQIKRPKSAAKPSAAKYREQRQRTAYKKPKTILIDRASEALEKLTTAYRSVNVDLICRASKLKNPSRHVHEAMKVFVMFVNAFRDEHGRWPVDYFNNWANLVHFVTNAPSSKELCLELQSLKKIVTRPHLANISEDIYRELEQIRTSFLKN